MNKSTFICYALCMINLTIFAQRSQNEWSATSYTTLSTENPFIHYEYISTNGMYFDKGFQEFKPNQYKLIVDFKTTDKTDAFVRLLVLNELDKGYFVYSTEALDYQVYIQIGGNELLEYNCKLLGSQIHITDEKTNSLVETLQNNLEEPIEIIFPINNNLSLFFKLKTTTYEMILFSYPNLDILNIMKKLSTN